MAPTSAPLLVACLLLALGGGPKIVQPTYAVGALRSVGVRVPTVAVRVMGAVEAVLGIVTAVAGGRALAALVALSYLGFAGFVVAALRTGGAVSSCGCVGRADTPPTRTHVAVTVLLAAAAVAAAVRGAPGLADLSWSARSVTTLAFAALSTWLAWLALAVLPRLSALRLGTREA
jgi:hypothetical protein